MEEFGAALIAPRKNPRRFIAKGADDLAVLIAWWMMNDNGPCGRYSPIGRIKGYLCGCGWPEELHQDCIKIASKCNSEAIRFVHEKENDNPAQTDLDLSDAPNYDKE